MTTELTAAAIAVLQANDRGSHTAPTSSAPAAAQRNWESCLAALGLARFDEDRAWTEIETLLADKHRTAWCRTPCSTAGRPGRRSLASPTRRSPTASSAICSSGAQLDAA